MSFVYRPFRIPVRAQDVVCLGDLNWLRPADGCEYFGESNLWRVILHAVWAKAFLISSMISAMRFSFCRMLSASCSGGRCSKSGLAFGFLISRLIETRAPFSLYLRTSLAFTFH